MDDLILQPNLLYATLAVVLICTAWLLAGMYRPRTNQWRLPPGPPGWPIIGNLPIIFKNPISTNEDYHFYKWSREYGDIYKLKFGPQLFYVLSNIDHIREVFVHSKVQGRAPAAGFEIAFGPGTNGLLNAEGAEWAHRRRFTTNLFRDLGVGRGGFADKIQDEIKRFVGKVDALDDRPSGELLELLDLAVINITCGIIFGRQYDYEEAEFLEVNQLMKTFEGAIGPSGIVMSSKLLCSLPFGPGKKLMHCMEQFERYLGDRICEMKSLPNSTESPNSFVRAFLDEMEKGEAYFDERNLIACCLELLVAGSGTLTNTLQWTVLFLITHPNVQTGCQQELNGFVEDYGMPSYSDRSKLPLIQATLLESARVASVVPMNAPHLIKEDLQLLGYDFPAGTMVLAHLERVNMNEEQFPEADEFRPERFIEDGHFKNDRDLIPFSVGRRACPGELMAKMEVFLFLVSILRRYTISVPEGVEMPDIRKGVYGVTKAPVPFTVVVKKRCHQTAE